MVRQQGFLLLYMVELPLGSLYGLMADSSAHSLDQVAAHLGV